MHVICHLNDLNNEFFFYEYFFGCYFDFLKCKLYYTIKISKFLSKKKKKNEKKVKNFIAFYCSINKLPFGISTVKFFPSVYLIVRMV
ncbi:hypothetical protein C1646_115310 [Rhizophagus diaphanus]|nr:hypothetical protein C1646_115310 [Rhizophagus diaphanus] [Rhizophagus sp. MUCL 43196]